MSKQDLAHLDVNTIDWRPLAGEPGVWEKILNFDEDSGSYTRLLKIDPGYRNDKVLVHEFWEETYTISGSLIDLGINRVFKEGSYSCVPPGKKHGSYKSPDGHISLEFRYFT